VVFWIVLILGFLNLRFGFFSKVNFVEKSSILEVLMIDLIWIIF